MWRHRGSLVAEASSVIQRLQKVPTEMMSGCPRRQSLALTYNPGVSAIEAFRGRVVIGDAGQPAGIPEDVLTLRADLERRPWPFAELLWPEIPERYAVRTPRFQDTFELRSAPAAVGPVSAGRNSS